MTLPAKRRAMSDAALTHACLDGPSSADLGPSASSHGNARSSSHAESLKSYKQVPFKSAQLTRSPTSPPQPSIPNRLGFAHSVTPHISNIGRQLAVQCAVNFESCRLRAPSQDLSSHDLELLCSPRQELDQ